MKPDWDKLMTKWNKSKKAATSLIAEVDCTEEGNKDLCAANGVQGFPTLKWTLTLTPKALISYLRTSWKPSNAYLVRQYGDLVGTAITPRPLVIVTTLPFAFLMSGRTVWIPRISPNTLMSIALLYVSIETHSTSPNVAHPALLTMPQSPFSPVFSLINLAVSFQSSSLVTSNWITCNLGFPNCRSSSAPSPFLSAKRQPAKTVNPRASKCWASFKPKPVSQPV